MRNRNMYYLTGQPGWMRFGYSPGWVGRSPSGLGPCAQYLLSGQWPIPQASGSGWPVASNEARLQFLKDQAAFLEQQLNTVKSQIESLEKEVK
jgi:hypothetical protein